jgi:hypothetical protein
MCLLCVAFVALLPALLRPGTATAAELFCPRDCRVSVQIEGHRAHLSIDTLRPVWFMRLDVGTEPPVEGEFRQLKFRDQKVSGASGKFRRWSSSLFSLAPNTAYYYVLTIQEELSLGAPTASSYKVGAFVTQRLQLSFRFDEIHVSDDGDDLSAGDLGFWIVVQFPAQPRLKTIAEWTLVYSEVDSGTTIKLEPLRLDWDIMADPTPMAEMRYGIIVKACDIDCVDCDKDRVFKRCWGMPEPHYRPASTGDYDTEYGEQWIALGTPGAIRVGTKPGADDRVRFVARGATRLVWSAPTAVVPDVSLLQPLGPWVKPIRDVPRAPAGPLRKPGR